MLVENFLKDCADLGVIDQYLLMLAKQQTQFEKTTLDLAERMVACEQTLAKTKDELQTHKKLLKKAGLQEKQIENISVEISKLTSGIDSELNQLKQQAKLIEKVVGQFIVRDDGTAIDTKTSLMWCRYSLGQSWIKGSIFGNPLKINPYVTLNKIKDFNKSNFFDDWRLPTDDELMGIRKIEKAPFFDKIVFPDASNHWFWASTPHKGDGFTIIPFGNTICNKIDVRLVRG